MTAGSLRGAVVDGDVTNGSVMAGEIAGRIKQRQSCAEIINDVMSEMEALFKSAPDRL